MQNDYKHIKCKCGGTIGMYNRSTFNCERCNKEFQLYKLDYDVCMTNNKTGWVFPMKINDMDKIYKTVEQECSGCGKHFYLKYCSDGNYEYIGEVCDCLATFHPVDGEPSFAQWLKQIKG